MSPELIAPTPPTWGTPKSALCWYDFRPGASILETSGNIAGTNKYDYIVCTDPKRPGAELFAGLASRLHPGGRLLLALNNKYGLKYWCGARGGESGKPFGELEGGNSMLSGAELRRELQKAGFVSQKWYYPISDHHYPRAVYSENKLPNRFFATISPASQISGAGVLLREASLFPGVIESGAFTLMCNAFIIEAAREPDAVMCSVDFAALTLYRPPYRAFVTTVNCDGTAKKTAAHPEGRASLQTLAENHARLIERGTEALPITLDGNSAAMPAIHHDTLWDYMQGRVQDGRFDRAEFIRIFDRLREDILKSSKISPPGSHGWDAEFGPVLRYAYTEMIPANCFYDTAQDAFIYFDQEHALQNTPYSVPLSRALMSITYSQTLSAHPGAMELLPELKERYGLTDCWDRLVKIEREFIAGLTNSTGSALEYNRAAGSASAEISANRHAHDTLAAATILLREYKKIGLYGCGKRGKRFAAALKLLGHPPVFIADSKTGGLQEDAPAEVIVVTPKEDAEEIADELRGKTSVPVITLDEIFSKPEFI